VTNCHVTSITSRRNHVVFVMQVVLTMSKKRERHIRKRGSIGDSVEDDSSELRFKLNFVAVRWSLCSLQVLSRRNTSSSETKSKESTDLVYTLPFSVPSLPQTNTSSSKEEKVLFQSLEIMCKSLFSQDQTPLTKKRKFWMLMSRKPQWSVLQKSKKCNSVLLLSIIEFCFRDRYIEHHMKERLGKKQESESRQLALDEIFDMELFKVPEPLKVRSGVSNLECFLF